MNHSRAADSNFSLKARALQNFAVQLPVDGECGGLSVYQDSVFDRDSYFKTLKMVIRLEAPLAL